MNLNTEDTKRLNEYAKRMADDISKALSQYSPLGNTATLDDVMFWHRVALSTESRDGIK